MERGSGELDLRSDDGVRFKSFLVEETKNRKDILSGYET